MRFRGLNLVADRCVHGTAGASLIWIVVVR